MTRLRKVVLKEKSFESPAELHALLAQELGFPDYYGANLDAFEDCLEDVYVPTRIIIKRCKGHRKEWFDGFEDVVRDVARRSDFVYCVIR
ncbi:MAG: barstar family protein [Coriobacteriales bacterium]|nr:barstar family protein [Coriobacteriales bacterium]